MKVDIEEVLKAEEYLESINQCNLEELKFYKGGEAVYPDPKIIERWNLIGLNNTDFICMELNKED